MSKPLLLTVGEPAGIGSDCVLRAFQQRPELFEGVCIIAPAAWLQQRADALAMSSIRIQAVDTIQASDKQVLRCWNPVAAFEDVAICAGKPKAATAQTVIACIRAAAMACLQADAAGMVTGPIDKSILRDAGFDFPGHTEYLAHVADVEQVVMMLASGGFRTALLTTHVAIRDLADQLSIDGTLNSIRIVQHDLQQYFAVKKPNIALSALNPHAGEQGHFGDEERRILQPAVDLARQEGIQVSQPLPADTMFSTGKREQFDTLICCYHDQALIPIKALCFGEAVNITLGLPFIRTSVDHGTAYDIVGSEQVCTGSLLAAIEQAHAMAACHTAFLGEQS